MEEITEDLTVQDILDEANENQRHHAILEIWREVLKVGESERVKKITPQWANRITSSYREINFKDVPVFKELYFDKLKDLHDILEVEIASDDECLNVFTPEEDVERNSTHYLNVLIDWQKLFLQWELDWDCIYVDAAVELAAISEVHRMVFDKTGITSLLDNIQFEITDADRDILAAALQELKEGQ